MPQLKVTAVCDTDADRRCTWARRLGCGAYGDHHEMLASGPAIVVVALPHALHGPVALDALASGRHVVVEKPMALTVADCRDMLAESERRGCALVVSDAAAYAPGAVRTGEAFARGDLGAFLTGSIINYRAYFTPGRPGWFLDPALSGGGMFANVGVHRLAQTRRALRGLRPARVTASVVRPADRPVEACTSALVQYEQVGSMLYEEVGYFPRPDWLRIGAHFVFERGIVAWDDDAWRWQQADGAVVEEALPPARGYQPVYEDLLRIIDGQVPHAAARDHAADAVLAQAAAASARSGQAIDLNDGQWAVR